MKTFYTELLTPDKTLYKGEILGLTVNLHDGKVEMLADFLPSVCYLAEGECKIVFPDGSERFFISVDGILDIREGRAVLTSSFLEWKEDVEKALLMREAHLLSESGRRTESFRESRFSTVALTKAIIKAAGIKEHR